MPGTMTMDPTTLQFKELRSLSSKVVSAEEGIVEALVAVTGNEDDGGDVILPKAFEFPEGRKAKIVWSHDMQVLCGKVLEAEEYLPGDSRLPADLIAKGLGALWFKVQFDLEDPDGYKAFRKVKFHEDLGWSIGYQAPPGTFKMKDGRRLCSKIIVWEASPVTFGMNREARSLTVKSAFERVAMGLPEAKRKAIGDLIDALGSTEGDGPDEEKVWPPIPGSQEERTYLIGLAVQVWAEEEFGERSEDNHWWTYVEATFPDSAVVSVERPGERTFMEFPVEGEGADLTLGAPSEVELVTTVEVVGTGTPEEQAQALTLAPKMFRPKETQVDTKAKAHEPHDYDDDSGKCQLCGKPEGNALHGDAEKAAAFEVQVKALEEDVAHLLAAVETDSKAGRVLARRNESRIRAALASITEVLSEVAKDEDDEEKGGDEVEETKASAADELLLLEAQMDLTLS